MTLADDIYRGLLENLDLRLRTNERGLQFPSNGFITFPLYDDTLSPPDQDPELYVYQKGKAAGTFSGRDKYLATNALELTWTFPSGRSGHGDLGNLQTSGSIGFLLEHDYTLVSMNLVRDATGTLQTFRITRDGIDAAQTSFNTTGATQSFNRTLNINFTNSWVIGCRLLSGTATGNVVVTARFRRRL